MLVLIDNYDSFTYNLVQYFQILGQDINVYKNDAISVAEVLALNPDQIVISPGPNSPDEAGISLALIQACYQSIPLLGVCLGHQSIAQALGGRVIPAFDIMHGKTSLITHHETGLFRNIPQNFRATRYHSLMVDAQTLPECLQIDAWVGETIMALSHRFYPLYGLQFHPEAILTEHGLQLMSNFLNDQHQTPLRTLTVTARANDC